MFFKPLFPTDKNSYLVIGNGGSVTEKERGKEIDDFDGYILRFNEYRTNGYEKYTGKRCDVWSTINFYKGKEWLDRKYKKVIFTTHESGQRIDYYEKLKTYFSHIDWLVKANIELYNDGVEGSLKNYISKLHKRGVHSSGSICVATLILEGKTVFIYGFDHFQPETSFHYFNDKSVNEKERKECGHDRKKQVDFFEKMKNNGFLYQF